jgi:hypothetical protein
VVQRRKPTQVDSPLQRAQLIKYFNHPAPHSEMTRPRGTVNGRRKNRDGQRMADADLEKTCREERDTHSRQRTPELSPFPNTLLFPISYTPPSFFLTPLRISPRFRIKRHTSLPQYPYTQQFRRHVNVIPTRVAEGEVAAARRGLEDENRERKALGGLIGTSWAEIPMRH